MLNSECVEEGSPIQTNEPIGRPYLVESYCSEMKHHRQQELIAVYQV